MKGRTKGDQKRTVGSFSGFVITLDAMVAVSFLFIAMVVLTTQTFQPNAPRGAYLKQLTLDALTVMEKNGTIALAIAGNSSVMRSILEATPEAVCMQVSISDSNGNQIATIIKVSCGEVGRELQTTAKPVVYEGSVYLAEAQSWYKKEG